jgi:predicted double-glycine peptidase
MTNLLRSALLACFYWCVTFATNCVSAQNVVDRVRSDALCGAKCLYVIIRAEGKAPDNYRKLVDELGPVPRDGYSLLQLRDCVRKYDLYAECVHATKDDLPGLCKVNSVILHLSKTQESKPAHYVLCQDVSFPKVTIFDASAGRASIVSDEILSSWTGNALLISNEPIDLAVNSSQVGWPGVSYSLLGIAILSAAIAIGLRTRIFGWLRMALLISMLPATSGCGDIGSTNAARTKKPTSHHQSIAEAVSIESLPQSDSGLWIEHPVRNIGVIQRCNAPFLVPVRIHNTDSSFTEVKEVRIIDAVSRQVDLREVTMIELSAAGGAFVKRLPVHIPLSVSEML